jgi:hypothetical protein
MATAMIYPKPADKSQNAKKDKTNLAPKVVSEGFSPARLSQARAVLSYSRVVADVVLTGSKPLDVAYQEALHVPETARGAIGARVCYLLEPAAMTPLYGAGADAEAAIGRPEAMFLRIPISARSARNSLPTARPTEPSIFR